MDVRKTVLVGHSAERMFDVIEAAEHYPDFLPWCARAVIVARDPAEVVADLAVDYHGIRFGFRTRNPKRRPTWMAIHLERGPFRRFEGAWDLTPLAADGCRVDFALHYDFDSTAMAKLARPVFDRIAGTLVDRFVARVDAVDAASAPLAPPIAPQAAEPPCAPSAAPTTTSTFPSRDAGPPCNGNDPIIRSDPS
jgi:ribosome-associated toxin RatA of RatAB toxin-antitoxin module